MTLSQSQLSLLSFIGNVFDGRFFLARNVQLDARVLRNHGLVTIEGRYAYLTGEGLNVLEA